MWSDLTCGHLLRSDSVVDILQGRVKYFSV